MEAPKIRKLNLSVVNRIAAGEIIQRPANALKELLENSIDAKSTFIQVIIKSGGLKYLQIQDNGTGIRKEDLTIVCERFTTSKLEKFEDLSRISTFGFRGEALSSISHIAHLTIQTRTSQDCCAYKATYEEGKLKESPKPCAGNQGTTITVEDLFFNLPQRLKTIKSSNDEFQKILDVFSKYAVHNSHIGFSLRKVGENVFRTPANNTKSENIKIIYGSEISKQILEINYDDRNLNFKMTALITDVNYSSKKHIYLFFINNRLVESYALKTIIEETYSAYLTKGQNPFTYINLELEPSTIDVNIHPTKHEVKLLNEDEIMKSIKEQIELKLNSSRNARLIYKQARLSVASGQIKNEPAQKKEKAEENNDKLYAKDVVRTDSKEQKLEKFLLNSSKSEFELSKTFTTINKNNELNISQRKQTKLTSILNMRKKIENSCSTQLKRILKDMVFVGVVDKTYSIFQFETKLFLCNTIAFSCELFYQRLIYDFENFQKIVFKKPLEISDLSRIALDCKESCWTQEDGSKEVLTQRVLQILLEKEAIMREYFNLKINKEGQLETIPILLENHKPSMYFLPIYILRLATEVDWDEEEQCFETFCKETAEYYSRISESEALTKNHKWIVEHVIYPGLKNNFLPNNELKKKIFELTNLPSLYKVFERC